MDVLLQAVISAAVILLAERIVSRVWTRSVERRLDADVAKEEALHTNVYLLIDVMRVMLPMRVEALYAEYKGKGYTTIDEKKVLEHLSAVMKNLHINGLNRMMLDELMRLPMSELEAKKEMRDKTNQG